ncbi:zinc finger protein 331 isoform X4 [Amyelois transitella]|uniref:zinc finger protein 331 isoform X4 n=1 Tax=Amyelois transitella TaxID=680683 RepID=UPI00298FEBA5|nr:zinc finger protein 331 isoform X4 [Amyelois transitella]
MAAKSEWRPGPTVCRCCLTEGCYKDISTEYFWMGKREVYAEMLKDTLEVTIAYSKAGGPNSNSRLICESCISRLRDATEFKRQVVECERMFMQHLDPGSSSAAIEAETEPVGKIKVEGVKLEKSNSDDDFDNRHAFGDDDDDDDDDLDNQPLTKLASKMPTKESVDLLDLLDNSKTAEKRKSSTKVKPPPPKKAKSKVEQVKVKPSGSKLTPKPEKKKKGSTQGTNRTTITECQDHDNVCAEKSNDANELKRLDTIKGFNVNSKGGKVTSKLMKKPDKLIWLKNNMVLGQGHTLQKNSKELSYSIMKRNALILFQCSYIYPFVHASNKYKCFICAKTYLDASLLKSHTVLDHTIDELDKKLSKKIRDKHLKVDVTNTECRLCLEKQQNFETLKAHLKNHGKDVELGQKDNIIPFNLGGDTFDCQICGEKYLKLRLLIIHMSKHYNNFSCEICGSVFISLILLKRHLQTHETGSFPCQKCDKVFNNSAKRTRHMRGVHLKALPRRCPICPERFNSNYQRTKHLRIVHDRSNGLFKCETCGKEFDLKYHLLLHIRSVHLQERNEECRICHSRFFSKYCLSRHMMVHSDEKNFKCGNCGKAYARRKNLKEHIKTHELTSCSICGHQCEDQAALLDHVNAVHVLQTN